jgi:hypothetical protein
MRAAWHPRSRCRQRRMRHPRRATAGPVAPMATSTRPMSDGTASSTACSSSATSSPLTRPARPRLHPRDRCLRPRPLRRQAHLGPTAHATSRRLPAPASY